VLNKHPIIGMNNTPILTNDNDGILESGDTGLSTDINFRAQFPV